MHLRKYIDTRIFIHKHILSCRRTHRIWYSGEPIFYVPFQKTKIRPKIKKTYSMCLFCTSEYIAPTTIESLWHRVSDIAWGCAASRQPSTLHKQKGNNLVESNYVLTRNNMSWVKTCLELKWVLKRRDGNFKKCLTEFVFNGLWNNICFELTSVLAWNRSDSNTNELCPIRNTMQSDRHLNEN